MKIKIMKIKIMKIKIMKIISNETQNYQQTLGVSRQF
jgi:hypothetical protein